MGLHANWSFCFKHVEFEGDDAAKLQKRNYINKIREWQRLFDSVKFKHRNRSHNQCVNKLAKRTVTVPIFGI